MKEKIIDFMIDSDCTIDKIIEGIIKKYKTDSKTLVLNKKERKEANKGRKRKIIKTKFFLFIFVRAGRLELPVFRPPA